MERDRADKIVEEHIVDAIVRKGERGAKQELTQIGSSDELRRILINAEGRHSLHSAGSNRGLISLVSVAVVVAAVLVVGFLPRYSTEGLYQRWSKMPAYETHIDYRGQEMDSTQRAIFDKTAKPDAPDKQSFADARDEALFYQAAALAHAADIDEAIAILSQLAADSASKYSHDAAWQLALTYLKAGERKKATAVIENIAQGGSPYKKDAAQLLKEIKQKRLF